MLKPENPASIKRCAFMRKCRELKLSSNTEAKITVCMMGKSDQEKEELAEKLFEIITESQTEQEMIEKSRLLQNDFSRKTEMFCDLLECLPPDFEKIEKELKNNSYTPEEVTVSFGKFCDSCFCEYSDFIYYPCCDEVEKYLAKWDGLESYHLQENALNKLFNELCPCNKEIEDVLLKCATLNDFYSTNIYFIYPVAKHILELDIDDRLQQCDIHLVDDIQHVVVANKSYNFYSFATKYCSHHKPEDFPIYDSYVEKVLCYFQNKDCFSSFRKSGLKNYGVFKSVLEDFRQYYNLDKYSLKQIDQYIWQLGKEYFPNKY